MKDCRHDGSYSLNYSQQCNRGFAADVQGMSCLSTVVYACQDICTTFSGPLPNLIVLPLFTTLDL